ncbi:uncharacterized protein LOC130635679 isoform X2 [Hydractinia symbiolongicarpus]|uniref:uncharacterized protein LOC130635679 isoform X2 n=1 Tax=Hydractinia symbiolongicarpus TaxID=13093 RepID=UPI00254F8007|nr:uncharacterized protein LOC130635679 isoform X2 [Hydractinia symbiolongicarpus]
MNAKNQQDENNTCLSEKTYSMSLSNIALPTLQLDSENEEEESDSSEPIVFHPKLHKEQVQLRETLVSKSSLGDSGIDVNDALTKPSVTGSVNNHDAPKNVDETKSLPMMKKLEAAEIELDHALNQCPHSNNIQPNYGGDLTDSGSSGSSLLGKLESVMSELKVTDEKLDLGPQNMKINSNISDMQTDNKETIKIDLRSPQVHTNHCVMQRYGSSSSYCVENEESEKNTLYETRQRLKEESARIICSNSKAMPAVRSSSINTKSVAEPCTDNGKNKSRFKPIGKVKDLKPDNFSNYELSCKGQNYKVDSDAHLDKISSSAMVRCVDSMLDNVNRMMYQISDPGDDTEMECVNSHGEVTSLYAEDNGTEIESEDEVVESYTVYDQGTGEESYISPNLYVSRLETNKANSFEESSVFENMDFVTMDDIDTESNVKIIDWSDVLQDENTALRTRSDSPVERPAKENIFDSLFTNSFLSVSRNLDSKCEDTKPNINKKPKRDILCSKKKIKVIGKVSVNEKPTQEIDSTFVSVSSGSMDKSYVADVKTKKTMKRNDDVDLVAKSLEQRDNEMEKLFQTVSEFRKEISDSIEKNNKEHKAVRKLDFQNDVNYRIKDVLCVACSVNATKLLETPSKEFQHTCNEAATEKKIKKTTQSRGVSTRDLCSDMLPKNGCVSLNSEEKEEIITNDKELSTQMQTKSSKSRKKKKNKASKEPATNEPAVNGNLGGSILSSDEQKEIANVVSELSNLNAGKILYDDNVTFSQSYPMLPSTDKELLLLKVPLESPGVCKTNSTTSEQNNSNNFIGLTTLFMLLLQGNKWKIAVILPEIPFDVVAFQQVFFNGELFLVVGIAENQNTAQQKKKRTKLGTGFFHAVSNYLNKSYLETVLSKIWDITEFESLSKTGKCTIPGSGKLCNYINITPDPQALQKLLAITPSFFVHHESKFSKQLPEELNQFHNISPKQDYTCITVYQLLSMYPRHMSELLKRLRSEAVELCGIKIGYMKSECPVLCISINEFHSTTIEEGKLLLSDCEQLRDLAISFNSLNKISLLENSSTLLNYAINKTYSQQELVRWFGPHYSQTQFPEALETLKSNVKSVTNKTQKKKWTDASNFPQLSQLVHFPSYAVLLMSSIVPSAFISLIVSFADKKGLVLTAMSKHTAEFSQLRAFGLNDDQITRFRYPKDNPKEEVINFQATGSFTAFLFYGNSALFRVLGLITKLTYILNNHVTGETLNSWLKDNSFTYPPSHNVNVCSTRNLDKAKEDYFAAFNLNDTTEEIFTSTKLTPSHQKIEGVFQVISTAQLNLHKPEIQLVSLVFYGDEILSHVSTVLKALFGEHIFNNLKAWRPTMAGSSSLYAPSLQLIGSKFIQSLTKTDVNILSLADFLTPEWNVSQTVMVESKACILVLQAVDAPALNQLQNKLSKFVQSLRINLANSNVLVHTDLEHVCRIMFYFFHCNELHADADLKGSQVFPVYLPEKHKLLTLDKLLHLNLLQDVPVRKISPSYKGSILEQSSLIPTWKVFYEIHPSSLSFPLQLLLKGEKTYGILSIQHSPKHVESIIKVISRITRLGFGIVGLKFPSFDITTSTYWFHVALVREDALFVLKKMKHELENSYQHITIKVTETVQEFEELFTKEFKGPSDMGGIFHYDLYCLVNEMCFEKDAAYKGRRFREVEWNSGRQTHNYEYEYMKQQQHPLSKSYVLTAANITDEVTVLLITQPLIRGWYLNKECPVESVFPQLWQKLEQASYRTIGAKMTLLSKTAAQELVDMMAVDGKKNTKMVKFLSQEGGPFIALVLLGSCVLSDFWMHLEGKFCKEEAVSVVKQYTLLPTTKKQVELLLCSLFQQVLQNSKVELRSSMV